MKHLIWGLLAAAAFFAPGKQTFTGVISDDMCAKGDHSEMRMGPTDAECVAACVSTHDAVYVLYDGKAVYTLSDQRTPAQLAAQKVTVTGTLDASTMTIKVESIRATK